MCYSAFSLRTTTHWRQSRRTRTSHSVATSIVDTMSDEFKYQRIEKEAWFGPLGKALSCHLISREHCMSNQSYSQFDQDENNRLALSADMHNWYEALNCTVPVFNIRVESVSPVPVISNRYEVKLIVRALDAHYGQLVALRMKEDTVVSTDRLEFMWRTLKYMEWKYRQIEDVWYDYYSMTAAVE